MDEQAVRQHAEVLCDALLAGDVGKASEQMSNELRSNLGPIVAMLPMPLTEATIESVEMTRTGYLAVLRLAGEVDAIRLETRWKDRDDRPTIVEVSHIPEASVQADSEPDDGSGPTEAEEG
jgi:hypothetical protein